MEHIDENPQFAKSFRPMPEAQLKEMADRVSTATKARQYHRFVDKALEKARKEEFGVIVMKASRGLQNPFRRSNLVRDRVEALDALVPSEDLTPFQKAFKWVLANEELQARPSTCRTQSRLPTGHYR